MKKAFAYYRVSSEEQVTEGKSIETQGKICRKWAKENGYTIVKEFIDEGKSATNLNRPALKDILNQLTDSDIEAILIQDTDRLCRNTLDHLTVKSLLKKHNVRLISISQPMIDDSPEGALIDTIIASVNAFQSQLTGRKTSKVLLEKAELGWYPGLPPLGYVNLENPKPHSKLDKKIVAQDETIVPHIKEIFRMYATGNYSVEDLSTYLNQRKVIPKRSLKVHPNTVYEILRNKFYIGRFDWGRIEYFGKHKAIVSESTFNKVQLVIKARNRNASRYRKHSFLLNGFIYDSVSNTRLLAEYHKKPSGREYSFYFFEDEGKRKYFDTEDLENQVVKLFDSIQLSEGYVNYVLDLAKKILKEFRANEDGEKSRLSKQKAEIEKAMREAEDSRFIHKTLDDEAFKRIYSRYERDIKQIEESLNLLSKDRTENIKRLESILRLAENIGEAYKLADYAEKRNYLALFFKRIYVKDGKVAGYELQDEVKTLIEEGSVRVRSSWGG